MTTDPSGRKTPPETPDDWDYIWRGSKSAHDMWPFVGPFIAIAKNLRTAVLVIVVVLWFNSPEIIEALKTLVGFPK